MTTAQTEMKNWIGRQVVDSSGDKVGTLDEIYLDQQTDRPEFLAVRTGLFGVRTSFVPFQGAVTEGDDIKVPFEAEQVKKSPNIDPSEALSEEEETKLYSHYGMSYSGFRNDSSADNGKGRAEEIARSDSNHDERTRSSQGSTSKDAMTRSEEELSVAKETHESGRVRLRKYLVTEEQVVTVPVTHEEVRLEREPITDANVGKATSGAALSEDEHEIVLHQEEVVVDKKVVPKERVRLDTETVTEDERVIEDVRKERIDVEGDVHNKG